jgi:hypothetical protein
MSAALDLQGASAGWLGGKHAATGKQAACSQLLLIMLFHTLKGRHV